MSVTYSVNQNTVTEAFKLSGVQTALTELLDNTSKLISPHDVRDAIFTNWENVVLKPTTVIGSGVEYIGIDDQTMVAQTGTGLKEKFLIGKRQVSGQNTMNNTILTSDIDVFFYNTKTDSGSQYTKVAFLAGTNSTAYANAPYIWAQDIVGGTIDLTIINPNGNLILNPTQSGFLKGTWFYGVTASLSDQLVNKYYVDTKVSNSGLNGLTLSNVITSSGLPSIGTGNGSGNSPSKNIVGTNTAGKITLTTGSGCSASSNIITVTYSSLTYSNNSFVVFSPGNTYSSSLTYSQAIYVTSSTTNFQFYSNINPLSNSTTYIWYYHVIGE